MRHYYPDTYWKEAIDPLYDTEETPDMLFKLTEIISGNTDNFLKWVETLTGLLLQSFPAVALWHNPGVPLLFTVSAFSTALAYLLLVLVVIHRNDQHQPICRYYERIDLMLIAAELVIIFSFYHYLSAGSESSRRSMELLWNDMGWVVGFIGFGLIVPFLLELKGVLKGWTSRIPMVAAASMVLVGGYLLRHYFMYNGVYALPW